MDFTSQVADRTLNRSAEVLQTVTPINDKVEEWDSNMKKNKYSVAAYEQAVVSAGKAGMKSISQSFKTQLKKKASIGTQDV